jgi:hypothetical protein
MGLAIELERKVLIENNKLAACQIVLQLLVVGFVGYNVFQSSMWNVRYDPVGSVSFWVTSGDTYALQVEEDKKSAICTDNAQFNYDDGYGYIYDNYECVELDSMERYKKMPEDLFIRTLIEEDFRGVFSATHEEGKDCALSCEAKYAEGDCKQLHPAFEDTARPSGESGKKNMFGDCLCECHAQTDFWPLGVEGLGVAFMHSATANIAPGESEEAHSTAEEGGIYTIVYDSAGNEVLEFAPGESVSIPVKKFLEIIDLKLDDTELEAAVPNLLAAPARKKPIARITGVEINVDISYHNPTDNGNKHKDKGYVAYITCKGRAKWNSQQEVSYGATPPGPDQTGLTRSRYMYNLSMKFRTQGKFSRYAPEALMGVVAILVIYIKIPKMIVGAIAEYCLGNISLLYQTAIRQKVDAETVFAGVIARGLVTAAVFDHLILPKDEGGNLVYSNDDEPTISSKRLEHLILDMLKSGGRINDMHEASKVRSMLAIEMKGNNRRKFLDVALNSDLSTLRNVADNFDSKRKSIPVGERMFKEGSKKRATVTNIVIPDFDFD